MVSAHQHVDGNEGLIDCDRPSPCLVNIDEREEDIELVAFLDAHRSASAGFDHGQRRTVILVCADWPDVHGGILISLSRDELCSNRFTPPADH